MKKRKDKLISVYLMFGLILLVIGFSYAFFIYNKTGLYTHTINGGKMKVIYGEVTGNNITIENAYPRTDEEALTKSLEFEFAITGYNESDKNIYYAIEIDHGEDVNGKTRFLDSDMKLSLYENDEVAFENEIFENLDNQDIYYGYFKSGTSSQSPMINNYKMRIWINDNVIISDTIEDDIDLWDDNDWNWAYSALDYDEFMGIDTGEVSYLSDLGISVYTSDEFANNYANFKVNVRADLTYDDIGYLTYDANGGEYTPKKTSLVTGRVTSQKPVMEGKGFLGWSTTIDGEVEYYSGDYYNGNGQILYAQYGDSRNVMIEMFSEEVYENMDDITKVYFINASEEEISAKVENALQSFDLTADNQGEVTGWLEEENNEMVLYVGSEGTIYLTSCLGLFAEFRECYYIDLLNIDTSMVTNMAGMFYRTGDSNNEIEVSFNGKKYEVKPLENYDNEQNYYLTIENLESLNTHNVESMMSMFDGSSISKIELESFDTENLTDISFMFHECCNIKSLDLSKFNTSNVENMAGLFYYALNIEEINFDNFNTSKVTDMSEMFKSCSIGFLNISSFDTSNVINMTSMFEYFEGFQLDLSQFNTSKVEDMSYMFRSSQGFSQLILKNFDTSAVTNMSCMFLQCSDLSLVDVSSFDTSNVEDMSSMFDGCSNLTNLDVVNFNTKQVINMEGMFAGCKNLSNLNVTNFDTSNVINMSHMFSHCEKLNNLDINNFDTSDVEDMSSMFLCCENLKELDLSNFDTSKVKDVMYMFFSCDNLVTIYCDIDGWDLSQVTSSYDMFSECRKLVGAIAYDSSKRGIDYANPDTGYFTRKY